MYEGRESNSHSSDLSLQVPIADTPLTGIRSATRTGDRTSRLPVTRSHFLTPHLASISDCLPISHGSYAVCAEVAPVPVRSLTSRKTASGPLLARFLASRTLQNHRIGKEI